MKVFFKKNNLNAVIPMKGTELSAGHDLTVTEVIKKASNKVYCKIGLSMSPEEENTKIVLVPRSSLTKTNWVMNNSPGIGDSDYTDEYQIRFTAIPTGINYSWQWKWPFVKTELTYDDFPYETGDRIGQMFLSKVIPIEWEEVDHLIKTSREGGFGSTGK